MQFLNRDITHVKISYNIITHLYFEEKKKLYKICDINANLYHTEMISFCFSSMKTMI